jgi:hypothetical protein
MPRLWPVAGGGEKRVDIDKFDTDCATLANPPDDAGCGKRPYWIMQRMVEAPTPNRLAAPAIETAIGSICSSRIELRLWPGLRPAVLRKLPRGRLPCFHPHAGLAARTMAPPLGQSVPPGSTRESWAERFSM